MSCWGSRQADEASFPPILVGDSSTTLRFAQNDRAIEHRRGGAEWVLKQLLSRKAEAQQAITRDRGAGGSGWSRHADASLSAEHRQVQARRPSTKGCASFNTISVFPWFVSKKIHDWKEVWKKIYYSNLSSSWPQTEHRNRIGKKRVQTPFYVTQSPYVCRVK